MEPYEAETAVLRARLERAEEALRQVIEVPKGDAIHRLSLGNMIHRMTVIAAAALEPQEDKEDDPDLEHYMIEVFENGQVTQSDNAASLGEVLREAAYNKVLHDDESVVMRLTINWQDRHFSIHSYSDAELEKANV